MAKKKKGQRPVLAPAMTKKQLSRWQKEKRRERLALGYVIGVVALLVGVLAFGFYQENIAKPGSPIARVNGVGIPVSMYARVMSFQTQNLNRQVAYWEGQYQQIGQSSDPTESYLQQIILQQYQQAQQALQELAFTVPDDLVADELVRQELEKRGVSISLAEVEAKLSSVFQPEAQEPVTDTASTTPTPTPVPANAWQATYKEYLTSLNVSDTDYRELAVVPAIRREKLQRALSETVATSGAQIHLSHIVTDTQEAAVAVLARVQAGEDFAALVKELSGDTSTTETGGDLGWYPPGILAKEFGAAFEDAAFRLQAGQVITNPVQTYMGFHIIKVTETDPNRPLEPDKLQQIQAAALDAWLKVQVAGIGVERFFDSDKQFWVATQVAKQSLPKR